LKYFKISTTFLGDFARIREGKTETNASLLVSLSFLEVIFLFICGLNWAFTLQLKEKLFLSVMRWS